MQIFPDIFIKYWNFSYRTKKIFYKKTYVLEHSGFWICISKIKKKKKIVQKYIKKDIDL